MSDEIRLVLAETGDQNGRRANEQLFAALYGELHRLADRELHRIPGAGVSPTTLVQEGALCREAGQNLRADDSAGLAKCTSAVASVHQRQRGMTVVR
jgi:hypothetical protein